MFGHILSWLYVWDSNEMNTFTKCVKFAGVMAF